jgi:uncharacterized protein (TIGR04255 family)
MSDPYSGIFYGKNFVKEVVARVDFLNPLPGVDIALPVPLTEEAIRTFPIAEPREAVRRQMQFGPEGVTSSEEKIKEWNFHGKERTKHLTIGGQAVLVQHTVYETFDVVKAEFVGILGRVAELFEGIQAQRVGLRYINAIDLPEPNPTDWSAYLAPQLLSLFAFPPEPERFALSRLFHNLELSFETFNLRYRFGMHNPDYPARIRQKVFTLDLDAYTHSVIDMRGAARLFDDFHLKIQQYFELSITENLRRIMNAP